MLASLVSAFYYLRVVKFMYFEEGDPEVRNEPVLNLVTALTVVGTILLFLFSGPLLRWASEAVMALL